MALTDTAIKSAKPRAAPYKIADGRGLFLLVKPSGSKLWRFRYQFNGKEGGLAFGVYPDVPLKLARNRRDEARQLVARGIDPALYRKQAKQQSAEAVANSFEAVTREWISKNTPTWSESHAKKITRRMEKDIFPWLGKRPIRDIEPPDLLKVLERLEARGVIETAHRARTECGQVFRYAVATGRTKRDIAADLRGALQPVNTKHFPTLLDPAEIGGLLRAIAGYSGTYAVRAALQLAPTLMVRPGELRQMKWEDVDLDAAEWRFVRSKLQRGQEKLDHIVSLSSQAVAVLRDLQPLTGHRLFVFPGDRNHAKPMSEATINSALRRMGYDTKTQITGHGFRAMARTLLAEQGWNADAIERQLAHKAAGPLRGAYDRTQFLVQRKKMMQAWADYLEVLKRQRTVVT
jgi:integrase